MVDVPAVYAEWEHALFAVLEEPDSTQAKARHLRQETLTHLRGSLEVIETALQQYSLSQLCLAFNGGKDCTVLLMLFFAAASRHARLFNLSLQGFRLATVYFVPKEPFTEPAQFVAECIERFNIHSTQIEKGSMKEQLGVYMNDNPEIKAILMGTRSTDPYADKLTPFCPTDNGWPAVMRVNPILKWSHRDIWDVIRAFSMPYCKLYDEGYTSIGSRLDTDPNPALQDPSRPGHYLPAHFLDDESRERDGRRDIFKHRK